MALQIIKNGPDPECKGLRFENGRWVRRYKTKTGKMKQYTFARHEDVTIEQAREYVESVRGQDNPAITLLGEPTIGSLLERYLNEYIKAQRASAAAATVRSALTKNLKPIMFTRLDEVTAAMLHEIILTVKKRAPTMARLLRSELKQAWSYGLSIGMTNTPCPITTLTGGRFRSNARDRILNDTELVQVLSSLRQYSEALQDIIIICLYTGLRSGEVVELHTREFEFDQAGVLWLTIPRERMKNKMAHRVPFFSKAAAIVDQALSMHAGYLFPKEKDPYKPIEQVTLAREVYRIGGPVTGWHLHDLRRTTRTNLQRLGCPFEISETILAHKLPGVASVYARFQYTDEKLHWLKALADYYDKLIHIK